MENQNPAQLEKSAKRSRLLLLFAIIVSFCIGLFVGHTIIQNPTQTLSTEDPLLRFMSKEKVDTTVLVKTINEVLILADQKIKFKDCPENKQVVDENSNNFDLHIYKQKSLLNKKNGLLQMYIWWNIPNNDPAEQFIDDDLNGLNKGNREHDYQDNYNFTSTTSLSATEIEKANKRYYAALLFVKEKLSEMPDWQNRSTFPKR